MTGKYESYFESFRSLTESESLLRVISVKPKFRPKMCHWNERGREPEEGGKRRFHFSCTHSKNSSHAQSFFHSTSRVILIHCVVESFRKTGSFSVIESKHGSAEKWVSNWINFTGRLKWLGNVLHGKSKTETCESLFSVMLQSFESLSVIQSFFHSCYLYRTLESLQYDAVVLIRSESLSHFFAAAAESLVDWLKLWVRPRWLATLNCKNDHSRNHSTWSKSNILIR